MFINQVLGFAHPTSLYRLLIRAICETPFVLLNAFWRHSRKRIDAKKQYNDAIRIFKVPMASPVS